MSVKSFVSRTLDTRRRRNDDNKGLQLVEKEYAAGWGWTIRRSSGRWHVSYYPASKEIQDMVEAIKTSPHLEECERVHFHKLFGQECRARDLLTAMRSAIAHRDALIHTARESISVTVGSESEEEK